jgi:hypothetical protein
MGAVSVLLPFTELARPPSYPVLLCLILCLLLLDPTT